MSRFFRDFYSILKNMPMFPAFIKEKTVIVVGGGGLVVGVSTSGKVLPKDIDKLLEEAHDFLKEKMKDGI